MTKRELINIATKYHMDYLKSDPITLEKIGVYCETIDQIPELDVLADSSDPSNVSVRRACYGPEYGYTYQVTCPSNWLDKYGWI